MIKKAIFIAAFVISGFAINGCSIRQNVRPVESIAQITEICVIRNDKVRSGFLDAYVDALKSKGFQARVLGERSSLIECPVTSTYTANWAWDLALYMRYAEIKIYRNATPIGEAVYDSTWGGGRLDKFIEAEKKIRELVDQLFQRGSAQNR